MLGCLLRMLPPQILLCALRLLLLDCKCRGLNRRTTAGVAAGGSEGSFLQQTRWHVSA